MWSPSECCKSPKTPKNFPRTTFPIKDGFTNVKFFSNKRVFIHLRESLCTRDKIFRRDTHVLNEPRAKRKPRDDKQLLAIIRDENTKNGYKMCNISKRRAIKTNSDNSGETSRTFCRKNMAWK